MKFQKEFARFLKERHLDTFTDAFIKNLLEADTPLLTSMQEEQREQFLSYLRTQVVEFLNSMEEENMLQKSSERLSRWKLNKIPVISREDVTVEDILTTYDIQKKTLLQFLPEFDKKSENLVHFVIELDEYFNKVKKNALKILKEVSEENLRKQAEVNQRLDSIMESTTDAVVIANEEGNITTWNKSAENLFHYTENEMLGKPLTQIMPERYRQAHIEGMERFKTTGKAKVLGKRLELHGLRKSGAEFELELSLGAWKEQGKWFFSGVMRDLSERKQIKEELTLLYELSELISESKDFEDALHIFIKKICTETGWNYGEAWLPDLDKKKLECCKVWYTDTPSLIPFREVTENIKVSFGEGMVGRVWETKQAEWSPDLPADDKLIEERRESAQAVGLRSGLAIPILVEDQLLAVLFFGMIQTKKIDTQLIHLVSVVSLQLGSVIKRKQAEEILQKSNELLEKRVKERTQLLTEYNQQLNSEIAEREQVQAELKATLKKMESTNKELKEFAYIVSHDLKAPLRAIGSLTDWIVADYKDKLDEQGKEQLALLKGRVFRMQELLEGILTYSRIGRAAEAVGPVDLKDIVTNVISNLHPSYDIDIKIETELPKVVGQKTPYIQIFQNLLSNAIKFSDKEKGDIRIGCIEEGDFWKFYIKDNGPGIEEKYFEKIFKIFQTLTPRDDLESTGIGLTIVKKIVELEGGKIWLESEVGKGSTFFFTIPKVKIPQPAHEVA